MILGKGDRRTQALKELLEFQRNDFAGILEAMDGLPVTVRLLDPPLHEFLPRINPDEKVALSATDSVVDDAFAASMGMTREEVLREISRMGEVNPMLGLRGCRLGITIPELTAMQVQALLEAAIINKAKGLSPKVEIMVPLIGSSSEFKSQKAIIEATAEKVFADKGERVAYTVGTMIEVPRAALTAEEIALSGCSFFSYGTNDLTQMTYGFSRDDVGSFLPTYIKQGILESDPFEIIDQAGVGKLIDESAKKGKEIASKVGNRNFKVGVCGEHGGDPTSVKFFHRIGMGYVSCSPFRVPLARLAAAHANIEEDMSKDCNI
jgi:pyruvate,orthophosphate dikinase